MVQSLKACRASCSASEQVNANLEKKRKENSGHRGMRAEALLAEGWVSPRLRLKRKRGENSGANEKAASSPALYNSVSQRLSDAITKFLQLGDFQWTIGFPELCVQRARTHQFFYFNCALNTEIIHQWTFFTPEGCFHHERRANV